MSETGISRRQFLTGAAVTAAVTTLPAVTNVVSAAAAPTMPNWPMATPDWTPLDSKALARWGYEIYKGKHTNQSACCEGTFWPILGELGNRYPDTWGLIPKGIFNFGGGGVNSWRAMCGCTNAGAAVLKLVTNNSAAIDEFLVWYEKTLLPTNACYLDYRSGTWTPGGNATGGWGSASNQLPIPYNNAPKSKANSVLCHASLANWRVASGNWELLMAGAQSDRCGKIVYDSVYKIAEMINHIKAGGSYAGTLDPVVATCKTAGCHGTTADHPLVQAKMKCSSCHDERATDNHMY